MFTFAVQAPKIEAALRDMAAQIKANAAATAAQTAFLQKFYGLVRRSYQPNGKLHVKLETENMDRLTYSVNFDSGSDPDTVKRLLTVSYNGVSQPSAEFPAGTQDLGTIVVDQDVSVHLELVDVDDAGNTSAPVALDFVAADTLPPALSGGFGIQLVSEENVPDGTPNP